MADINEIEKSVQEIISESTETPETSSEVMVSEPEEVSEVEIQKEETPSQVQELEVLGKKYSNLKELAEDYERLYKKYQELTTKKEESPLTQSEEEYLKEARRVLKEKLGLLFSDDETIKSLAEKVSAFEEFMNMVYEEMMKQRDEMVIESLKRRYDGSHGEPKFDLEEIRKKVQENPDYVVWVKVGEEFYPDLEATYKKIYAHYFESKTPMRPSVVKTEGGLSRKEVDETIPTEPKTYEEKISQIEKFFSTHLGK